MGRTHINWRGSTLLLHPFSNFSPQPRLAVAARGIAPLAHRPAPSLLLHAMDKCVSGACLIILTPVIVAVWIAIRRCAPVLPITGPKAINSPMRVVTKRHAARASHRLFETKIEPALPIAAQAQA